MDQSIVKKSTLIISLFLLSLFATELTFAASPLTGKILDKNNNPMIGAQIELKDSGSQKVVETTISDFNGSYAVFVEDGTYDITIVSDTPEGKQTQVFSNQKISSSVIKDLKMNAQTNAPISEAKSELPLVFIAAIAAIILVAGFVMWKTTKKKK